MIESLDRHKGRLIYINTCIFSTAISCIYLFRFFAMVRNLMLWMDDLMRQVSWRPTMIPSSSIMSFSQSVSVCPLFAINIFYGINTFFIIFHFSQLSANSKFLIIIPTYVYAVFYFQAFYLSSSPPI